MSHYLFTSESVSPGHPDKVCDQISDRILDACLTQDPDSRVACEAIVSSGLVFLTGEISTTAELDYQAIVRQTLEEIGYDDPELGFDARSCGIMLSINEQSADISLGVTEGRGLFIEQGAGDQGMMFGFACDETEELMPLPIMLAHKLQHALVERRKSGALPYLRPDAKSQVTVEYAEGWRPVRVHTVVISTQHIASVEHEQISKDMRELIVEVVPDALLDAKTRYYINPTGRFVVGGPAADAGLTGRKIIVDTYGGMGRHGGGAFSGKDPSKVDRSAAYAARHVAKNLVASGLCRRAEVQFAYAIGVPHPVSIKVDTFGTSRVQEELLARAIPLVFDLTPKGIIDALDLKRPIYAKTSWGGHFGRLDPDFTWESIDRVDALLRAVRQEEGAKIA